jgi:hypothetical protein
MPDREDFRDELPDNSRIENLLEWMESGDVDHIHGHIDERGDSGSWETFIFEIIDSDLDQHSVLINESDLPEDWSWEDFFDYLEWFADENDIDYENAYGE